MLKVEQLLNSQMDIQSQYQKVIKVIVVKKVRMVNQLQLWVKE